MRFKIVYAPQRRPQQRADDLELQTSGQGILEQWPVTRFQRRRRRRLSVNWREAISNRTLLSCQTQSRTKLLITIVTSYDRLISNVRPGTAHANVESALIESILRLSGPFPKRFSVSNCP